MSVISRITFPSFPFIIFLECDTIISTGRLFPRTDLLVCVLRGGDVGVLVTPIEEPGDDARLPYS